jgi:hypothetical protein
MPCVEGLQWNDNEKQSDWPAPSTCGGTVLSQPPTPAEEKADGGVETLGFDCVLALAIDYCEFSLVNLGLP